VAWHRKFGFAEIPDAYAERVRGAFLKRSYARAEGDERERLALYLEESRAAQQWVEKLREGGAHEMQTLSRILMPGTLGRERVPRWLKEFRNNPLTLTINCGPKGEAPKVG
jgi:hypothetical protein